MQFADLDTLVQSLFQNQSFKLLLKQQVGSLPIQKTSLNDVQVVMEDISDNIHSLIQFKLKQTINEDLPTYLSNSSDYRKQIDALRQEVTRLHQHLEGKTAQDSRNGKLKNLLRVEKIMQTSAISDRTKSTLNSQNLQISKMRQQLDLVKATLNRLSSNNILQFVSEANLQIHQRMQQNFTKLNNDIQQLSIRNSETDLEKSSHSVLNCYYQQDLGEKVCELQQKMMRIKTQLQSKMQANLKSVWNVITNMQNNLDSKRSSPTSGQIFQSPTQKTIKKGGSFASLLGWKS